MFQSSVHKVLLVVALGLITACCLAPEASEVAFASEQLPASTPKFQNSGIRIEFPELGFSVDDVDPEDFTLTLQGRTATIKPRAYGGIDGSRIRINRTRLSRLTARIRFELGALQYLTDDVRAKALDFSHQTDWTVIDILNNEIQVPQFYKNREKVIEVHKQVGFRSEDEFLRYVEAEYFETLKALSYRMQTEYYSKLLKTDRARYAQCCPEYVKQAEEFLGRSVSDFKSFSSLGVELYLRTLTLELDGVDETGQTVKYTLIGTR